MAELINSSTFIYLQLNAISQALSMILKKAKLQKLFILIKLELHNKLINIQNNKILLSSK